MVNVMENEEQSASNGKEKIPVSGKKQVLLQWRNYQDKKKKSGDTNQEISFENFENEAKKLSEKINLHAQRKGQDGTRISSASSSQTSLAKPNKTKPLRMDVQSCQIPDEEDEEKEEGQEDEDKMWMDLDQEFNNPRTALACMNLPKNSDIKASRRRRPRRFKKIKAARSFRGEPKPKRKTGDDEISLFSSDKESEHDDQRDFGRKMSSPNEYFVPNVKPFRRLFDNPSHVFEDEQQESDPDKWVYNVLTVPNYKHGIPFCKPYQRSSPSPPLEPKASEERFRISQSTEQGILHFGLHGPSRESKSFTGSPPQIPESDVVQTLPNVVPRYKKEKRPIQHWHSISNEPFYEEERGLDLIVGFTTRLMGKAKPNTGGEDMVKPFHCHRKKNEEAEDNYLDGYPDRVLEDPMYMCPEDPILAFNKLLEEMKMM